MGYYLYHLYKDQIPEGYIAGLDRRPNSDATLVAHLYKGTFSDPGDPMCRKGWNRGKYGYSIWRNNIGIKGICKTCLRRIAENREPISFPWEGMG